MRTILLGICLVGVGSLALPAYAQRNPLGPFRQGKRILSKSKRPNIRPVNPSFQIPLISLERIIWQTKVQPPRLLSPFPTGSSSSFVLDVSVLQVVPPLRPQVNFPGKEQIDAIIFDMDGTLLDSLPAWKNSASNFLRSQGIEPPPGLDDEMSKLSLMEGARIIKERYGFSQSAEEILESTLAPIWEHYLTDIQAKPGALQLLKDLHKQGIKISVATASHKELAQRAFERLGMLPYIDFIITCDEVGIGKQSPDVYDSALKRLGTRKERTLVVEDALYALQTAKKAGYLTAGIAEPFHSPQHERDVFSTGDYFIISFDKPVIIVNYQ